MKVWTRSRDTLTKALSLDDFPGLLLPGGIRITPAAANASSPKTFWYSKAPFVTGVGASLSYGIAIPARQPRSTRPQCACLRRWSSCVAVGKSHTTANCLVAASNPVPSLRSGSIALSLLRDLLLVRPMAALRFAANEGLASSCRRTTSLTSARCSPG